jgi:hypothetical protein
MFQQKKKLLLAALVLSFAAICAGHAAALADYRHRVSEAIHSVEQAQRAKDEPSVNGLLQRVRLQLPAKETILISDQSIAVDNSWLPEALDGYERIKNNSARRNESLARIRERLLALAERMAELENESAGSRKDNDNDKARLAEILRRPEYDQASSQSSALERLWLRFLRRIFSLLPKRRPLQPGNSRLLSSVAQVIVVLAGLALVGFLVWKFGPRFLRNRKRKKEKRAARIVLGERLEADQTAADLLSQAEDLARGGDLRAAIRKAYIAFLCELADRKLISLAQHKTNRDYLVSVREQPRLYSSMRQLTNAFEVHWYGLVPAAEGDWNEFRSGYSKALKMS